MAPDRMDSRVFVVDDESVIASTLAMILSKQGFEAHAVTLPLESLERAHEIPPNLLISDVVMPLLSGIELAIRIRELCPSCKVLLFSGQAATVDLLAKARASGHHFEVLSKPVHPADLLRKVETVFAD
jgi:CheY-like chemotaxis protein